MRDYDVDVHCPLCSAQTRPNSLRKKLAFGANKKLDSILIGDLANVWFI